MQRPSAPPNEAALEELLSRPRPATIDAFRRLPGDVIVLGAGGKMGPTLARMARRAATEAEGARDGRRIIAVSRFHDSAAAAALEDAGVATLRCDLLDRHAVDALPDAPNVIFMAGQKFGTGDAPAATWAMNTLVPAFCAERYTGARIVAFSTGNVYPLVPVTGPGARESDTPAPVGEYAASCLGRERMFEHASARAGTRVAIIRLNYAVDLRYGVLVDIASRVRAREPIDLSMGHVNVVWQGDANRVALESLVRAAAPPYIINVTGAAQLSVRSLAERFGALFGVTPEFTGREASDALLSDTSRLAADFAPLEVDADTLTEWVASWIASGGALLGKPTKFERRDGRF